MKNAESKVLRLIARIIDSSQNAAYAVESMIQNECADLQDIVDSAKYSDFYREDDMINVIHEYLDLCRDNMDDDEIESTAAFIQSKTMQLVSPAAEPGDDALSTTVSAVVKETAALFDSIKGESNERS